MNSRGGCEHQALDLGSGCSMVFEASNSWVPRTRHSVKAQARFGAMSQSLALWTVMERVTTSFFLALPAMVAISSKRLYERIDDMIFLLC
jgi:hypothetical protein